MTKALFKKQMMEVFSWVYFDRKNGKNRSKGGIIGYAALYLFIFGFLGVFFFQMASTLCKPLCEAGFGWLYFALMGLISVAMGVFGSVFNTYSSLYKAKDNDFLLSLPIPPRKILLIRLSGVYLMGLMYELIIALPTILVYFISIKPTALSVIFNLLIPLILSFFVLTLSCILGFVVAAISSRLKNKNIVTVILSLLFIAGYYYIYAQSYQIIQSILANPEKIGNSVKGVLYLFYQMGMGAQGKPLAFLIFTLIVAAHFFITYLILSKSFLSIATTNKGSARKEYKEKKSKVSSLENALLKKELLRFYGSSTYMLNCGLGTVLMPVAAVAVLIAGSKLNALLSQMLGEYIFVLPLLAAAAVCMLSTMNDITSPSVSLEGKNLWLVQSFPIPAKKVLHAKLQLHLLLTVIPAVLLTVCVCIAFKISLPYAIAILAFTLIFIFLMALIGLALNLKMPNLNWTDPTVPVKQSLCVMLALFGGWVIVLALGGLYLLVMKFITPLVYLIAVSAVTAVIAIVLLRWIDTKGTKIFETL
ncbi:MAG: hypothetical protein ACI4GY_09635 [Acutalibacteraceae bacterium]